MNPQLTLPKGEIWGWGVVKWRGGLVGVGLLVVLCFGVVYSPNLEATPPS